MESTTILVLFAGILGAFGIILCVILMVVLVVKCSEWCFPVELTHLEKLLLAKKHVEAILGSNKLNYSDKKSTQENAVALSYPIEA